MRENNAGDCGCNNEKESTVKKECCPTCSKRLTFLTYSEGTKKSWKCSNCKRYYLDIM